MKRCRWVNLNNESMIRYHDEEWGVAVHDDPILYEFLILECFQAGLSWECILNKREAFRKAYADFDLEQVILFDENKKNQLMQNPEIIRNRLKIEASIQNSLVFKKIQQEFGSFDRYLWGFTNNQILFEHGKTTNAVSDQISKDLKKRGMRFVGSITIYSYLQAVGIINSHEEDCWVFQEKARSKKTDPCMQAGKNII